MVTSTAAGTRCSSTAFLASMSACSLPRRSSSVSLAPLLRVTTPHAGRRGVGKHPYDLLGVEVVPCLEHQSMHSCMFAFIRGRPLHPVVEGLYAKLTVDA